MKGTKILLLAVFALPLLLAGCEVLVGGILQGYSANPEEYVSLPPVDEMQKDGEKYTLPKSPAPGKAMIYVVRPYSGGGGYIFNVFVDDKEPASEMGYTRGGQYICFNLEPGKHLILSSAGNWAEMEVNAKTGEIIYVRQRPRTGYLPELYWNELSLVSECEGKYLVRRLEPGVLKHADKPETK